MMSKSRLLIGDKVVSTRIYGAVEVFRNYPRKVVPEFNTPVFRIIFDNNIEEYSSIEKLTELVKSNPIFTLIHPDDDRVVGRFDEYPRLLSIRTKYTAGMPWNEYPIEIMMGIEK